MEESKVKTAEITTEALEVVFSYIKSIGAHIVYTDPYDYSAGVEVAAPDYQPETAQELAYELGLVIDDKSHITKLEAEINSFKTLIEKDPVSFILVHALRYLNDNDRKTLIEKLGRRVSDSDLEARNKELELEIKLLKQKS